MSVHGTARHGSVIQSDILEMQMRQQIVKIIAPRYVRGRPKLMRLSQLLTFTFVPSVLMQEVGKGPRTMSVARGTTIVLNGVSVDGRAL